MARRYNRFNSPSSRGRITEEEAEESVSERRKAAVKVDPLVYKVCDEEPDKTIVDERGNVFIALRNVSWNDRDPKLELRKWYINSNGDESPNKGVIFLTEDGPHALAEMLVRDGFGDSAVILECIKERDDYDAATGTVIEPEDTRGGKKSVKSPGFDISTLLSNINVSGVEEEEDE